MKPAILLSCLAVFSCRVLSQFPVDMLWTYEWGTPLNAVLATDDNGCVAVGTNNANGYFVRLDSTGNEITSQTYDVETLTAGCSATGGGYAFTSVVGEVVRTDSMGVPLWTSRQLWFTWPQPYVMGIAALEDSGFVVCGGSSYYFPDEGVLFLARFNLDGDTLWTRTYDSMGVATGYGIAIVPWAAGLRVTGTMGLNQGFTAAIFYSGNLSLWRIHDFAGWSAAYDVVANLDPLDDGAISCGIALNLGRLYLASLRWNNELLWYQTYEGNIGNDASSDYHASSICRATDGGLIACGNWWPFDIVNPAGMIWKLDEDGNQIWSGYVGNFEPGYLIGDVAQPPDGSILICGAMVDTFAYLGSYVAKVPATGFLAADPRGEHAITQALIENYPNPFNARTTIALTVPIQSAANVSIIDLLGRRIATLHDGMLDPGEHRFTFDASALPSGIYFAWVHAGDFVKTQKLLLLK